MENIQQVCSAMGVPAEYFKESSSSTYQASQAGRRLFTARVKLNVQLWDLCFLFMSYAMLHRHLLELEARYYAPDSDMPWEEYRGVVYIYHPTVEVG